MRIIEFGSQRGRAVIHYGSQGVSATGLIRSEQVALTVLHIEADGEVGRHPAVSDQLFMVVSGRGRVRGGDNVWHPISAGQAAVWTAGEPHTTQADEPITALVLEVADLALVV